MTLAGTLMFFGLLILVLNLAGHAYDWFLKKRCTGTVQGVAQEVKRHRDHYHDTGQTFVTYAAWIRYEVDGKAYRSKAISYNPIFREGGGIAVHYDPARPSRIRIDNFRSSHIWLGYIGGAILIVLALVFRE